LPSPYYPQVHIDHDVRSYLPDFGWEWVANDEGYVHLSCGRRGSDSLVGVYVTLKGRWLEKLGDLL
jgi:hypothetical protein